MSQRNKRLAEERNKDRTSGVVFAGASAARLHGIGDLWADRHDFVSPVRRKASAGRSATGSALSTLATSLSSRVCRP